MRRLTHLGLAVGLLCAAIALGACRPASVDDTVAVGEAPAGSVQTTPGCTGTNAVSAAAPTAIEPIACLSVGVLAGDPMQEFDRVVTPFLMRDGSLAVPTVGARSIRIFGPDGRFLRELGGPGEGPGEFRYLAAAWSRGDTIEAFDLGQQRITRFLSSGEVETARLFGAPVGGGFHGPWGSGWAASRLNGRMGARDSATVVAISPVRADSLATRDIVSTWGMHRVPGESISGPHPLTPTSLVAAYGDEIYVGETLTPRLAVYGADGRMLREIVLPLSAPTDVAAAMRAVVDSADAMAGDAPPDPRRQLVSRDAPERLSVFWALIIDELGYLWVRPYDPIAHSLALDGMPSNRGGPGGRWLVLSPAGVQVGWIDVPDGFEPLWIGREAVVGVYRDDLDVESVRVHRLDRR